MKKKVKSSGGATTSQLHELQGLVVSALTEEIKTGIDSGEMNQAAIRNALQLLRENHIVATDDTMSEVDKLASLLPDLTPVSMETFAARF